MYIASRLKATGLMQYIQGTTSKSITTSKKRPRERQYSVGKKSGSIFSAY
jgi:hypothetical protein